MIRALVIGDGPEFRLRLRSWLEANGCRVAEARLGAEALALARETPPDLAVSDRALPEPDGPALLRQWRADPALGAIPFFLLAIRHVGATDTSRWDDPDLHAVAETVRQIAARKQVEEADERRLLHRLLEAVGDGVHALDRNGDIVFENAAALRMFGWPTEPMLGLHAHALMHHHHADGRPYPVEDCPIHLTLRDGQPRQVADEVFFRRNGSSFPVEYSCNAVRGPDGRVDGVVVSFRDVAERQRTEAALRESEERSRRLADAAFEGIVFHQQGRILEVHRAFCAMFGYDREEELIGRSVLELAAPESRDAVLEHVRTGSEQLYEAIGLRRDGSRIVAELRGRPLALRGRQVRVAALRDITERKRVEERVAHLTRLYATRSQINQTIARVRTPEELFPAIGRAAVEHGGFALSWIGRLDRAAQVVTAVASHGSAAPEAAALRVDVADPRTKDGLIGRALRSGRLASTRDIRGDPGLDHIRALAEAHDLRAAAAVPFQSGGDVAGFLLLAAAEVDYFVDPELQELVTELAADISFALDAMAVDERRRRAEQAERHARAFADATIQSLPGVFYLFTDEGRYVRWNRGLEIASGYTGEEIAQLHPLDLFTGQEKELIRRRIGAVFTEGASDAEAHLTAKDGTRTPYYFTGCRVLLDGRPHLVGMGVDLSARRRAEAEASLLRAIALGVGEAGDLDEALALVLRQVCEMTGWAVGEVWLPSADRSRLECQAVWHGATPGLEEFGRVSRSLRFAPGEGLPGRVWQTQQAEWVADLSLPSRFPRFEVARRVGLAAGLGVPVLAHGEVVLVLDFFLFEPTEEDERRTRLIAAVAAQIGSLIGRKRAEAERASSESRFRSLIENASDLVTVLDVRGVIRFQGPSSERLLGRPPEAMTNRPASEWIHPDDAAKVADAIDRALANPGVSTSVDHRFLHTDGSWRTLESIGRSLTDASGESVVALNSRDVTQQRELEERLRQSQKMEALGHLAGGVAHDFNNLLAALLMQTELLRARRGLPTVVQDGLRQVQAVTERAADLTRQLLLFGRKQVLQPRDLDLNEVVASLVKMLQRIIGEDVRLELYLHPTPLRARADGGMLS